MVADVKNIWCLNKIVLQSSYVFSILCIRLGGCVSNGPVYVGLIKLFDFIKVPHLTITDFDDT